MRNKIKSSTLLALSGLLVLAGVAFAAWILQAKSTGAVLGTKSKHLEIATFAAGSCDTFVDEITAWPNRPEMLPGAVYQERVCLKSNKNLTSATFKIENIKYYKFDVLVGPAPAPGDEDLVNYITINHGEPGGVLTATPLISFITGVALPFDSDVGVNIDSFALDPQMAANVEDVPSLNGYKLIFDLVATGNEL